MNISVSTNPPTLAVTIDGITIPICQPSPHRDRTDLIVSEPYGSTLRYRVLHDTTHTPEHAAAVALIAVRVGATAIHPTDITPLAEGP